MKQLALLLVVAGCGAGGNTPDAAPLADATTGELSALSDEFDSASLGNWIVRSTFEGRPSDGASSIMNRQLVLYPQQGHYFLDDQRGLSLFKLISTAAHPRFVIETRVEARERNTTGPPTENFHAAGLVIYPDTSDMSNWVVVNIGRQDSALGFEDKSTVNDSSSLMLYNTGAAHGGLLRLCVVDGGITAYTQLDGDNAWTQRRSFSHTRGEATGAGVMINDYLIGTDLVEGRFDYVHFASISDATGCTADL